MFPLYAPYSTYVSLKKWSKYLFDQITFLVHTTILPIQRHWRLQHFLLGIQIWYPKWQRCKLRRRREITWLPAIVKQNPVVVAKISIEVVVRNINFNWCEGRKGVDWWIIQSQCTKSCHFLEVLFYLKQPHNHRSFKSWIVIVSLSVWIPMHNVQVAISRTRIQCLWWNMKLA